MAYCRRYPRACVRIHPERFTPLTPYYQQDGITIYHGDCCAVIPALGVFDLLLTDPPYGIGFAAQPTDCQRRAGHKPQTWDDAPVPASLAIARHRCRYQVIFGGNYYDLPPARCVLAWVKPDAPPSMGNVEYAWTNLNRNSRVITYTIAAMRDSGEKCGHPTQKPETVIRWAMSMVPDDAYTVLDPFMGSGTTLVAAKRMGRQAVGIERDERYCEMAAERLSQGSLFVAGDDTPAVLPSSGGLFSESITEADGQTKSI